MLTNVCALERRDYGKIRKLNALSDITTFWDDVRKIAKGTCHNLNRWQCLSEIRYWELEHKRQYTFKDMEEEHKKLWENKYDN